ICRVDDTRNEYREVEVRINATVGKFDINLSFPNFRITPTFVPEFIPTGTEVFSVEVRRRESIASAPMCELRGKGSETFELRQRLLPENNLNASLQLTKKLDFETQIIYVLQLLCKDVAVNREIDTRNLIAMQIIIMVTDQQDSPPFFVDTKPLTVI
ncbi:unnamed protein product, partial [Cyprideis torosa]